MRECLNMGLPVPSLKNWFRIGSLLLLVLGIGLVPGEVGADNHETQQIIKVTGSVVDNDTEMPIAAVSIRVTDTQIRVKTDETGAFSLELPSGTYKIHASAPFYNTFVIPDFQVSRDETSASLDIKMTPQVVKLDAIKLPIRLSQASAHELKTASVQRRLADSLLHLLVRLSNG